MTKDVSKYLFTSARLGFRPYEESDIEYLAKINADERVMEFFPSVQSVERTSEFVSRMMDAQDKYGFCYFAVETLVDARLIGFIGLCKQTYEAEFTPCVDIGWRLAYDTWGRGFATEGAKRCLAYGFEELGLNEIFSVASVGNIRSIKVMEKIGMQSKGRFEHINLVKYPKLRDCSLYSITKNVWTKIKS